MHFFDTSFLDQQIDLARQLTDYTLYFTFWSAIAYFTYQFVDGLDFFLPLQTETSEPESEQPAPESIPLPSAPGSTEIEFVGGSDEWEPTVAEPVKGWTPSKKKPATSLEDILNPQEEEPLSFEELKNYSIRQLKKLASGRISSYSNDPKETLAQRLAGKLKPSDLTVLA
jgi:hypothetical protein